MFRKLPFIKISITLLVVVLAVLIYVDANLVKAFSGRLWAQPAQVFARPLELYQGAPLTKAALKTELIMLGYQWRDKPRKAGEASLAGTIQIQSRGFQFEDEYEASRLLSFRIQAGVITDFSASDSTAIARLEPLNIGSLSPSHTEDRLLVSLSQVPLSMQQLIVASEDKAFYQHHGISFRGIARAGIANVRQKRLAQGGSTLTQQLVKNYFLTPERTLKRKLQELVMAALIELHLDKGTILESYINEIYLAQDGPRAIHGFGLASEYFFEKPVSELALHEQALLVALVRGPSYYNPLRNPVRAQARRDLILDLAAEQGFISEANAASAKQKPLQAVSSSQRKSKRMPAYLDLVNRQLRTHYSDEDLSAEGLRVFTFFDPVVQADTEAAIVSAVAKLPEGEQLQAAAVIIKPNSGAVLAVVGDKNPRYPGFNRALDAKRHVGSVIKPALYLTALSQPQKYNLLSLIKDEAFTLPEPDGSIWAPQNFDGKEHGDVPLYQAMARSYNLAAAGLGLDLGVANVAATIRQLGVEQTVPEYPSVLLGALSLPPIEVAQMYQTIAGNGFYAELNAIRSVQNQQGEVLNRFPLVLEQRFESKYITLLQFAMNRVTIEGSAKSLSWRLPKLAVAGKTGTSNLQRDSWFAGFSGDLLGIVWMGKDDNTPTKITGASGALTAWAGVFSKQAQTNIRLDQSEDLTFMGYDPAAQTLYKAGCDAPMIVPFIKGSAPQYDMSCRQSSLLQELKNRVFEWLR